MWYSLLEDFLEIFGLAPRSDRDRTTVQLGAFPFRRRARMIPIKTTPGRVLRRRNTER
jgi:hypothetical protein